MNHRGDVTRGLTNPISSGATLDSTGSQEGVAAKGIGETRGKHAEVLSELLDPNQGRRDAYGRRVRGIGFSTRVAT
jgi:hypothetical protein